jgi:hypothetical protein
MHSIEFPSDILVYGTGDCEDTKARRAQLAQLGLSFQYHALEITQEVEERDAFLGPGKHGKPTIVLLRKEADREVGILLEVPTEEELKGALVAWDLIPPSTP